VTRRPKPLSRRQSAIEGIRIFLRTLCRWFRIPVDNGKDEITQAGGLGLFLRSLTGLDRKAAKKAFSSLSDGPKLSSAQTEFLDLTINYLTERGTIDPERFYDSPFTDLSDQGISGVFAVEDIKRIVDVVREIRLAAIA